MWWRSWSCRCSRSSGCLLSSDAHRSCGGSRPVNLPDTLHGQLYLLTYDPVRGRLTGDDSALFGFALRAAMLTDLYLTGHLADRNGVAYQSSGTPPSDPVLHAVFAEISIQPRAWERAIETHRRRASRTTRDHLEAAGWLHRPTQRKFGFLPTAHRVLADENSVALQADRVRTELRRAIDGGATDARLVALGLLGVLGQLPTVLSFRDCAHYQRELRVLTFAAIKPILGLHQAIERHHTDMRHTGAF